MSELDAGGMHARQALVGALGADPDALIVEPDVPVLERSDYAATARAIVDRVSAVEGVHSIHQFGEVGAPGVSDLDVLVVLEPEAIPRCAELLDGIEDRILLHEPFYVPPAMMPGLARIFPMNDLRRIHGEPIEDAAAQASSLSEEQEILTAIDFSLSVFSKSFFWLLRRGQVPLRDTLILIRLFCHSLSRIAPLAPHASAQSWERFVDTTLQFRARWQEHGEEELRSGLFEILATAAVLALELNQVLAGEVERRQLGAGSAPRAFAYGRARIIFHGTASLEEAVGAQLRAARASRLVWAAAPRALGTVLNGYADCAGPYSGYLRSGLLAGRDASDPAPQGPVPGPVQFRADVLNSLFASYKAVGYARTPPLAYYGYRPPSARNRPLTTAIHGAERLAAGLLARWALRDDDGHA